MLLFSAVYTRVGHQAAMLCIRTYLFAFALRYLRINCERSNNCITVNEPAVATDLGGLFRFSAHLRGDNSRQFAGLQPSVFPVNGSGETGRSSNRHITKLRTLNCTGTGAAPLLGDVCVDHYRDTCSCHNYNVACALPHETLKGNTHTHTHTCTWQRAPRVTQPPDVQSGNVTVVGR